MKFWNIVLSVLVVFLLYFFITSYPVIQESNTCVGESKIKMSELQRMVIDLQWNKQQVCSQGAALLDEVNACLANAYKNNPIGRFAIRIGSLITPQLREDYFTTIHNQGCAEYPDLLR